jgi:anti-sigma factor (TIGR02949 family)
MQGPNRLTCEEVFARLDDFVDRELAPEEIRLVREHLETCIACANEYRFESHLLDGVRAKLRRIAMPDHLRSTILAALTRRNEAPES